jgi:hypothetical protein
MARPWSARCYGVARQREGSRQNSIGGGFMLVIRYRFKTRAVFESGARLQLEELILKLASAPSAFLKAKMPPALIQASKSLR